MFLFDYKFTIQIMAVRLEVLKYHLYIPKNQQLHVLKYGRIAQEGPTILLTVNLFSCHVKL